MINIELRFRIGKEDARQNVQPQTIEVCERTAESDSYKNIPKGTQWNEIVAKSTKANYRRMK
jgi:hypothetical protein